MFRIPPCLSIFALFVITASSSANELSRYEKISGWQLLFDGKSTDGWRNYQSETVSEGWTVKDGVLSCSAKAGDLITNEKFDHFELSFEYRISQGGNSGVLFHVTEDSTKAWHSGPELQILDNENNTKTAQKAGYLYELYQPERPGWSKRARAAVGMNGDSVVDASRPFGEWNQIDMLISKDQCQVALNGHAYYKFRLGTDDWNQRVAKSKFAEFPNFGKAGTGHICLQEHRDDVSFRNIKLRKLTPEGQPFGQPIDGKLALTSEPAFPNLGWDGWEPVDSDGRNMPLRFMELTHVGDQRLFAAAQKGQIFVFRNQRDVEESTLLLDITNRVSSYRKPGCNEEGLLGLAFHPRFEQNRHFFVYYSAEDKDLTSRVSRFTVSKDDPNRADPESEFVVMEIEQPFHNHNGGSIEFGPDGYLYVGLGDGGDMNDPLRHGQNLSTLLGSILRIDIDRQENGKNYAIPKDNPFVSHQRARPEIFAFGVRNPWRLAVDSKRGDVWMADVGQDLWEEINIVQRGGNYGWSIREGTHPFGNAAMSEVSKPLAPIWEYDHRVGRSITGGRIYNGSRIPELTGKYLYADYVTGRVWALDYDRDAKEVKNNMEISDGGITVTSFGEDSEGEVYYMIAAANGQCIYRFVRQ